VGGVITDLMSKNIFIFRDNAMVSCRQTGLYINGEGSNPLVLHNVFMVCKCPSIIIDTGVNAFVGMNEMQINDVALQIINNHSYIFENIIQKSIDNGIEIKCIDRGVPSQCSPLIQKNYIEASTHYGIVVEGFASAPNIKGNIIEANRKAGIKLTDNSRAHIGGTEQDEIDLKISELPNKKDHLKISEEYARFFEDKFLNNELNDGMFTFNEVIDACAAFKEEVHQ